MEPIFTTFVANHPDDVVSVIYHTSFPYPVDPFYYNNVEDNEGRRGYYGVVTVPNELVDGTHVSTSLAALTAAYNARKAVPTDLTLAISGDWDADSRQVDVAVTASTSSALAGEYRLFIVLTESEIFFDATNGIDFHEYTMRDMFPDASGTPVVFSGDFPQTAQASASFTLPTGAPPHEFVAENCRIVCFLQEVSAGARSLREIHQAADVHVTDLGSTGIADTPAVFELGASYPNPFNPSTTIPVAAADAGSVRLEIVDVRGRSVCVLHDGRLPAGRSEFRWDGTDASGSPVASGVYLSRLVDAGGSRSRRLVLIK